LDVGKYEEICFETAGVGGYPALEDEENASLATEEPHKALWRCTEGNIRCALSVRFARS
jgi:hypothetical protein